MKILSYFIIGISALGVLSVSIMAFFDPQSVMDLVQVKLTSTDAFSSIRGVYGGAGLTIAITMIVLARKNFRDALLFIALLWGSYAISRLITIMAEGPLGSFGTQWIIIEGILTLSAILLYIRTGNENGIKKEE